MRYTKMLRLFTIVIVLSLLLIALPVTPAYAASIDITPEEGIIGTTVTVTGTDFNKSTDESDKYAVVYFSSEEATTSDDIDTPDIAGDVTTYEKVKDAIYLDTEGAFEITFTVPARLTDGDDDKDVTGGTYYIYVCHYLSMSPPTLSPRIRAVAEFTVIAGEITIDPEKGPGGTEVEINGTDFTDKEDITFKYDGASIDIKRGDDQTDSNGDFTSYILIPESAAGEHKVAVEVAGNEVEATFTVEPEMVIKPTSGEAGTTVTVSGTGFGRRQEVVVYFKGAGVATITTDSAGSFDTTFKVPDLEKGIAYDVEAEDEDENLDKVKFTIAVPATPTPTPSPSTPAPTPTPTPPVPSLVAAEISATSGKVGADIVVTGAGFKANSPVTVKFDDKELAVTNADANGLFIALVKVPSSKSGERTISITDGTSTKKLTFTVESVPPSIPAPLLPAMGGKVKPPLIFDWAEVTADNPPATYALQVATDDNFAADSIVLEKEGLTKSEYTLTEAEMAGLVGQEAAYYWRIRAVDSTGNEGDWTGAGKFYVTPPFGIPKWALYTLLGLGGLALFAIGYWMGRRAAYYY
jgi:hypothetical protein